MAGLINENMPARDKAMDPAAAMAPDAMGAEPPQAEPAIDSESQPEPDENDPAFQQALTLAYEALYKNAAAKDVAKQLKLQGGDLAANMADVAYNITSIVDERTEGAVPDEMLVPLAMQVLEEVGEIADAAGLDPQPEDIAIAFKTMILRYLGEQGVDTTQLQQAMDQVDPAVFRQAAEEGGEVTEEEVPV